MNRSERRRAQRMEASAKLEYQVTAGALGTLARVADDLLAGRLDPGTPGRAVFVDQVRGLEQRLEDDPARVLRELARAFGNPPRALARLAASAKEGPK